MGNDSNWIVFDGEITPAGQPVVPAVSRGLMYGDGVFETFRTYAGRTLLFGKHIGRLYAGLETLGITKISELEVAPLKKITGKLLAKQELEETDAIVRLQVWRDGQRGYGPDEEARTHFSIMAKSCPDTFSFPRLATVDRRRIPSEALPSDVKFTNGINYILAAREAAQKEADDALMQTTEGWISETTIANIFWSKEDRIFTPSLQCDLIPGITRGILTRIIEQNDDWELREGEFNPEHIVEADTVWICNSVREVLPVRQVDDRSFDTKHRLLKELRTRFCDFRDANLKSLNN